MQESLRLWNNKKAEKNIATESFLGSIYFTEKKYE